MARGLSIVNDASYGTERSYNGIRFAGSASKTLEGFEDHSRADAAMFRQVSAS
jgi:hypothetical protein